ncbi:MAG: metal ABC transporter ATP-binding protein [Bacteroides sp.]|nr:metal ABC transporter ATP-binding protein [Bacteroides sp.]
MPPIIHIDHLCAGYDGVTVLHDVCLTVHAGEFLGIIGPNGGGKTTLIRCILGLLKPSSGSIRFTSARACPTLSMGYLPQMGNIDRRFPITVEELVLSGLSCRKPLTGRHHAADHRLAADVILRMGLEGMERRPLHALSGGQLQRALLGRAVISEPEVLILDEPSTYIDKRFETHLYRLLSEIHHEGCAIILVSHDIGTVLQQVGSIACVNGTLDYHPSTQSVTGEWLERNFQCPIELLGHGSLPHRILAEHRHEH